MSSTERYSWHAALWQKLQATRARLPHALLLQGRSGTGKLDFAYRLSQSLLCSQPGVEMEACGACQSCNWFAQGHHPDFRLLEPAETDADSEADVPAKPGKKTQIAVDQVRDLADFFSLSSHQAGLRIVLLHPAEALNVASANALLKMLEEPPAGVIFMLVSHQPQRLLPTIRSRCNTIDMPVPTREQAQQWLVSKGVEQTDRKLAYAGGSPLQAISAQGDAERLARDVLACLERGVGMDPFAAAAACARVGMVETCTMLQKWLYDLLSLRMAAQVRYHDPMSPALQGLGKGVDLAKLLEFQRIVDEARRHALHPLNLELQLEALMIQYTQIFPART